MKKVSDLEEELNKFGRLKDKVVDLLVELGAVERDEEETTAEVGDVWEYTDRLRTLKLWLTSVISWFWVGHGRELKNDMDNSINSIGIA